MPQNSLRSVVYRSFLTCDDPKGVAECSSLITKSESHKKQEMQQNSITTNPLYRNNSRTLRDSHHSGRKSITISGTSSNASLSCDEESKDLQEQSSFRLLEVSKGAKKLNEMIESFSNRPSSVVQSDYIARDLLKGALDLQDSLVMLGKLQETSRSIPKSKKKEEFVDFQKPRASVDCYEELREVIRESFCRQNILPNGSSSYEKRRLNVDLSKDVPSSSSSTRWSSESLPKERPKGSSNLVAKLMGLDDSTSVTQMNSINCEKKDVSRNVLLDIDLPRPRGNPEFMIRKPAREVRKMEEIIQSMQFKGLVGKEMDYYSDISLPPIVVMKPLHILHFHSKELRSYEENPHKTGKQVLMKMKGQKVPVSKAEVSGRRLKNDNLPAGRAPKQKIENKQQKLTRQKPPSVKMKHSEPLNQCTQRKGEIVKKINNEPKVVSNMKKQVERKVSKSQDSVKSQAIGKTTVLKPSKQWKGSNESNATKNAAQKHKFPKPSIRSSTKSSKVSVDNMPRDDNLLNITSEDTPVELTVASYSLLSDSSENVSSSPSESSRPTMKDETCLEDGSFTSNPNLDALEGCKSTRTNMENFFICNDAFVSHANLLFDTGIGDQPDSSVTELPIADNVLLIDCAKEIVERKSTRIKAYMPSSKYYLLRKSKCHLSQLVSETCDGIEDLRSYSKSCVGITPVNILRSIVDRDICSKGEIIAGAWDLGWRNGFTVEDVNLVANELQNLLLSKILDDLVAELMYR